MALFKKLRELDVLLATIVCVLTFVAAIWLGLVVRRELYVISSLLFAIPCLCYLIAKKYSKATSFERQQAKDFNNLRVILNVVFLSLFLLSIFFYLSRTNLYVRPLTYFILTALSASVVSLEIVMLPNANKFNYINLIKIMLIGISLEFSELALFPSVIGGDSSWHQFFTNSIFRTGHIPSGTGYSLLPFMHLNIDTSMLVTGLGYKAAMALSISFLDVVLSVLIVYLIGKSLLNNAVGLLGGLLTVVSSQFIAFGFWAVPNTLGVVLALPILYIFIKENNRQRPYLFLTLILMAALVLTHTVATFTLLVLLLIFNIGLKISRTQGWKPRNLSLTIIALLATGAFSWWAFASGSLASLAFQIGDMLYLNPYLIPSPNTAASFITQVPLSEQLFKNFGMTLFFAVSLIGCFLMISWQVRTNKRFMWSIGCIVLIGISTAGLIFLPTQLSVPRWWYITEIMISIPLALALITFFQLMRNKIGKFILVGTLIFLLSFLMIMSPTANIDNRTFTPNVTIRNTLTQSEKQALSTVLSHSNKTLGLDSTYSTQSPANFLDIGPWLLSGNFTENQKIIYSTSLGFDFVYSGQSPANSVEIGPWLLSGNFTENEKIIYLIRNDVVDNPFALFQYQYQLAYDPRENLTEQLFSRVYDCGTVNAYIYSGNNET